MRTFRNWVGLLMGVHLLAQTPSTPSVVVAGAAVVPPISVTMTPTSTTLTPGNWQAFLTSVSNTSNQGVLFYVNGIAGGNPTIGTNTNGNYRAPLTLVSNMDVVFTAVSVADNSKAASSIIHLVVPPPPPPISVTISPTNTTLTPGNWQAFLTSVSNTSNQGVTFYVNGIPGGNPTIGTNTFGNYRAPLTLVSNMDVVFTAVSVADTNQQASATIHLVVPPPPPPPISVTISPTNTTLTPGNWQAFLTSVSNSSNQGVSFYVNGIAGGNPTIGTNTNGNYRAPLTLVSNMDVVFTAVSVADTNKQASATIHLVVPPPPPPISITMTPTSTTLTPGNWQAFTTTLINTTNQGVLFYVNGIAGGNPTIGTNTFGNYRAPLTLVSNMDVVFTAVSVADYSKAASSIIHLVVPPPPPPISVTITPTNTSLTPGNWQAFTTSVSNTTNQAVTFYVNGIPGGNSTIGTNTFGNYRAPLTLLTNMDVVFTAVSVVDTNKQASAIIHLLPNPAILTVSPYPILQGNQTVVLGGRGFLPGTLVTAGTNPLTTLYISPGQIQVSGYFPPTLTRLVPLGMQNPAPYAAVAPTLLVPSRSAGNRLSFLAACRILEQASWGPDAVSVDHLQQVGLDAWWSEQLAATPSSYYVDTNDLKTLNSIRYQKVQNAISGPDQLRQRVAYALEEFIVISGVKNIYPQMVVQYLNTLSQDALGNFGQLLTDIALSPCMGYFLDIVNNDKSNAVTGTVPNQNFAREVMQLFSIGPTLLKPDGSWLKDSNGLPVSTYGPDVVDAMARVFTGWTYNGPLDTNGHAPQNFSSPMIAVETNHDTGPKTIFQGIYLPPGQTARQDLNAVVQALVNHPNVAPFVSFRLIQHLVTSNPSQYYVGRISSVFTATGGDLNAVVHAILTDVEARQADDPTFSSPTNFGHLREPFLYATAVLRNLVPQAGANTVGIITANAELMGQTLLSPPSVFGFFSPTFSIGGGLFGPEFQILSQPTAVQRLNFVNDWVVGAGTIDPTPYLPFTGNDPSNLISALNNQFFYGQMPDDLRLTLMTALANPSSPVQQVMNAIYLVVTSNYYQVQR